MHTRLRMRSYLLLLSQVLSFSLITSISVSFFLLLLLFVVVIAMIVVALVLPILFIIAISFESSMLLFFAIDESSLLLNLIYQFLVRTIISWCHTCAFILSSGPHQTLHHPPPDTTFFVQSMGKKGLPRHTAAPEVMLWRLWWRCLD